MIASRWIVIRTLIESCRPHQIQITIARHDCLGFQAQEVENMVNAAPELLEALERLVSAIDCDYLIAADESVGSDAGDSVYRVTEAARAAIAKAKGESA